MYRGGRGGRGDGGGRGGRGDGGGRGGGGRGGGRREQQPPGPGIQRGGGRAGEGRGRGAGGRGRGVYDQRPAPPPAYAAVSSSSAPPGRDAAPSSSASPEGLAEDLQTRLTLQPQAQAEAPTVPLRPPLPSSSKALRIPGRPGFGEAGQPCIVKANHFIVESMDVDIHHYDVSITPEVISKGVNRNVMRKLVSQYKKSHLGNRMPAYDGRKGLYTAGSFPFQSKEFVVNLEDNAERGGSSRRDRQFKVVIKFASKADHHHLREFLQGSQLDAPQDTIQALDVVLRESQSCKDYTLVGRSFFHDSKLGGKGALGDGVDYWKGFYQSLRPTQMGLSLNIDVSARSFYEPEMVHTFVGKYMIRDISRPLSDQDRVKVKKVLKGLRVEVTHASTGRRYKISSLSSLPASQLKFTDDTGNETSVVEYFGMKYHTALKHPSLPCIQAGSDSKPIYLPMEVCKIVKGQRYTKKLNERQVTGLLRATCQRPPAREGSIKQIVKDNNYSGDHVTREFGLQVKTDLTPVPARVLPPPMLKYHDTGREVRVDPRVGQWNMINKKMVNGGNVQFWSCLNFSSGVDPDLRDEFCYQLTSMCESKGMVFNPQPILAPYDANPRQIEAALLKFQNQCTAEFKNRGVNGKQLQLLIIILPDFSGSYGKIKRVCETELGIVSQCCLSKNVRKLSNQYFENVALKINVKVGGRNSVLVDAILKRIPHVTDRPTIIFGADVTHPPPGEDSNPSIAAVVASMDWPEVTKYRGLVSAQSHREELISDLYKRSEDPHRGVVHGGMIREQLIAFRRSTGFKPHRIIFYRDGVSEGQFSQVLLYEIDAIRKACASLEEGYLPPITFVVVQKRHHTRLFPNDQRQTDRSGNILPGTVVDNTICHPTEFDFYLNSHAGIQGTSRPTHYHVLYDENQFSADALQILTNNLCYTYARCTRSVSVVPPAYYAHLAAFRARYYIEDASDSGSSRAAGTRGQTTKDTNAAVRALPVIKENVKDIMFFC